MFKKNNFDQKRFPGGMSQFGNMPPQAGMNPFMQPGMPQQAIYPGPQGGEMLHPGGMYPQGGGMYPQGGGMLPGLQQDRLQYEIMENRRRINNLAKRVARVESYLRIKDVPEYGYVDDEKPSNFSY